MKKVLKKFNDSSVLSSRPKIDNVNSNVVNVSNNLVNVDTSTQKENKKEIDKDKEINIDKRALVNQSSILLQKY